MMEMTDKQWAEANEIGAAILRGVPRLEDRCSTKVRAVSIRDDVSAALFTFDLGDTEFHRVACYWTDGGHDGLELFPTLDAGFIYFAEGILQHVAAAL